MTRRKNWAGSALLTGALAASSVVAGPPEVAEAAPSYRFRTVASNLSIPWDVMWVGNLMLFDQRAGGIWSQRGSAAPRRLQIPLPAPYVNSEGGLLGMVADPKASTNKIFYTCQTTKSAHDVRVLRWRLTSETKAVRVGAPLVTGIPLTSGRHTGCRLRFSARGMLYIGTGDAAETANAQRLSSLGGKVLRVHPDGRIPRTNPFYSRGGNARYVWNYGHRNVQGLALRPGTTQIYSAEHGTDRDDEVNRVRKGANYGWQPGPGYNETRPMTDRARFPKALGAVWSSGYPTVATSGITFLSGSAWGSWNGALAVAQLKGTGIRLIFLDAAGKVTSTRMVGGTSAYGRIRTVQRGPGGALYFTTSNGSGDSIVEVTPT
jgi:glucose/arabinose dehydrogenase